MNEIIYTANILQNDMQVNMTANFFKILCNKLKKHTSNVVLRAFICENNVLNNTNVLKNI